MSTIIKIITGKYEKSYSANAIANYSDSDISLTRFAGDNGAMLQITISNDRVSAYVQLTQSQVKLLANTLKDSFNYSKYPSD